MVIRRRGAFGTQAAYIIVAKVHAPCAVTIRYSDGSKGHSRSVAGKKPWQLPGTRIRLGRVQPGFLAVFVGVFSILLEMAALEKQMAGTPMWPRAAGSLAVDLIFILPRVLAHCRTLCRNFPGWRRL